MKPGRMRLKRFRSGRFWLRLTLPVLLLLTVYVCIPVPEPLFPADSGTVVLDRDGNILRVFLDKHQQWQIPSDPGHEIPEKLEQAILLKEDRFFYYHPGVNPLSVCRAIVQNIRAGRIVSGASTITMQLTRIMDPKARTFPNKFLEMLQALKIEIRHTKQDILRQYLEHAPFGGNIVGYRTAALKYFGKDGCQLTWSEAATLAVIPNAPGILAPGMDTHLLNSERNRLLRKLNEAGYMDGSTLATAIREPVPGSVLPSPMSAPHVTRLLHQTYGPGWIRTSLDSNLQRQAQQLTKRHADMLNPSGIRHAAIIVVENESGFVRAYVGSPDFFDRDHQGQVDGVQAPRSTGSILKPFLYALSMDDGLITTRTKLLDIPTQYGAFAPANADESYGGLVPVPEALTQSLNVPAVRLLNAYGIRSFYSFLQHAGMKTLFRSPSQYGLPLVLGGSEATLLDLAVLYRGLANGGRFSGVRLLSEDPQGPVQHLISPGAAWLTLDILRRVNRPGVRHYWHMFEGERPVAWKTGTSYGRRDAWAVGVTPDWTVAVWCGNFDGSGNATLGGAETAGPLLFEIMRILPRLSSRAWFARPWTGLRKVRICAETGYPAGTDCAETVMIDVPSDVRFRSTCPWHVPVELNDDESRSVCSRCWVAGHHHSASRLAYPPDVVQLMRERGIQIETVPPHTKTCPVSAEKHALTIIYPEENTVITVPRDYGGVRQSVTCRAAGIRSDQVIYWYLDRRFLGMTRSNHQMNVHPGPGKHQLTLVDQSGNRTSRSFSIAH